jgi:hypothetical protein
MEIMSLDDFRKLNNKKNGGNVMAIVKFYIKLFEFTTGINNTPSIKFKHFIEFKNDKFVIKHINYLKISCRYNILKDIEKIVDFFNKNDDITINKLIMSTEICIMRISGKCYGFMDEKKRCILCEKLFNIASELKIKLNGNWETGNLDLIIRRQREYINFYEDYKPVIKHSKSPINRNSVKIRPVRQYKITY